VRPAECSHIFEVLLKGFCVVPYKYHYFCLPDTFNDTQNNSQICQKGVLKPYKIVTIGHSGRLYRTVKAQRYIVPVF